MAPLAPAAWETVSQVQGLCHREHSMKWPENSTTVCTHFLSSSPLYLPHHHQLLFFSPQKGHDDCHLKKNKIKLHFVLLVHEFM